MYFYCMSILPSSLPTSISNLYTGYECKITFPLPVHTSVKYVYRQVEYANASLYCSSPAMCQHVGVIFREFYSDIDITKLYYLFKSLNYAAV